MWRSLQVLYLDKDSVLVSFDVISLFISVPIKRAIEIASKRLQEDETLEDKQGWSLEFRLSATYLSYKGKYYQWYCNGQWALQFHSYISCVLLFCGCVLPVCPMYVFSQVPHGIWYTTPVCNSFGNLSLGCTRIFFKVNMGLKEVLIPRGVNILQIYSVFLM